MYKVASLESKRAHIQTYFVARDIEPF